MSDNAIKPSSRTDWTRLQAMSDVDIDYSDIPPLTENYFATAQLILPNTIRLDPDIIGWFRQHEADIADRINHILRDYIDAQEQTA